ncbi:hypothetical protein ACKC9G_04605 [Pokkaliibacter sp. CJK22405]|uniref:hypothetical protein n=1 Tax=Pokkaliibacter sp. CJK22405 TaxID=3384615 RepID=UPI0039849C64
MMHSVLEAYRVRLVPFLGLIAEQPAFIEHVRQWRNHESVRQHMFTQEVISAEQHQRWVEKLKTREDLTLFVAFYGDDPLAVASVSSMDDQPLALSQHLEAAIYRVPPMPAATGEISPPASPMLAFAPAMALNDWCFSLNDKIVLWARVLEANTTAQRFNDSMGYEVERWVEATPELPYRHVVQRLDRDAYTKANKIKALLSRVR